MHKSGRLIAQGRAADVYEHGDGRVLRRYRTEHDCAYEAKVMAFVREHGYPAPEVFDVDGRDIVLERLVGPSMLEDMTKHPWRIRADARVLAELHRRLHDLRAPEWLDQRHDEGNEVVHLDLHPLNVMMTPSGPFVIDWTNAGRGSGAGDVADTWLLLANARPPRFVERALARALKAVFLRDFLRGFDLADVRAALRDAGERRLRDHNMSPSERERIKKFVAKHGGRTDR